MSAGLLVRVEIRHALAGGLGSSARRRRLGVRLGLLACASVAAALAVARSGRLEQQPTLMVVLTPPLIHLTVGLAAMLLDQTAVRDGRGPLLVLPVGRRAQRRIRRAPWIVLLMTAVLAAAPTLLVVLNAVGASVTTGAGVVLVSTFSGLGVGLACSVVGSLARTRSGGGFAAPVATTTWFAWAALVASAQRSDGWWNVVGSAVGGWPTALDLLQDELSTVGAGTACLLWLLAASWLAGAPVAPEQPSSARVRWSFGRAPFTRTVLLRCTRHSVPRAHWSVAALVVVSLVGVDRWRSSPQTEQIALTTVILTIAVCACAARSLDGPVPLDVRWFIGAGRHVAAVLAASFLLAVPLAVVVLAHLVGSGRAGPAEVVLWIAACLAAGAVGTLVSATSGGRAGDAWVEMTAIVVVLSVLAAAGLLAGGGTGLAPILLLAGATATAASVLSADRLARRGIQS